MKEKFNKIKEIDNTPYSLFPNEPHNCYEQKYIILLISTIINNLEEAQQLLLNRNQNFARFIKQEKRYDYTILILCAGAVHNLYQSGYRGDGNTFKFSVNYIVTHAGLPACIRAMSHYSKNRANVTFINPRNSVVNTRFEIIKLNQNAIAIPSQNVVQEALQKTFKLPNDFEKNKANYFAKKATEEMDKLWIKNNWNNKTMEFWAQEHLRKNTSNIV